MPLARKYVVLASAFVVNFLVWGCTPAMGIFTEHVMEHFRLNNAQGSVMVAFLLSSVLFSAPVNLLVIRRLGYRKAIALGGVLAAFASSVCSCIDSFAVCVGLIGVLLGTALNMAFLSTILALRDAFPDSQVQVAFAVNNVGGGLGLFFFPYFYAEAIRLYSWQAALLLNGALLLNLIPCGMLLPNTTIPARTKRRQSVDNLTTDINAQSDRQQEHSFTPDSEIQPTDHAGPSDATLELEPPQTEKQTDTPSDELEQRLEVTSHTSKVPAIDRPALHRSPVFVALLAACFFLNLSVTCFWSFVYPLMHEHGYTARQCSLLMLLLGLASVPSRLLIIPFDRWLRLDSVHCWLAVTGCCSLAQIGLAVCGALHWLTLVCCAAFGAAFGVIWAIHPAAIASVVGDDQFQVAFTTSQMFLGLGSLGAIPLGTFIDTLMTYTIPLTFVACLCIISFLVLAVFHCQTKRAIAL